MGQVILEPLDAPELSEFLLVDVFTSVSTPGKKEEMISSFKAEDSTLRVIIATSAFGMGVDCPNIRKICHRDHHQILNSMFKKQVELVGMVKMLQQPFLRVELEGIPLEK